jgi:hypothetical protein
MSTIEQSKAETTGFYWWTRYKQDDKLVFVYTRPDSDDMVAFCFLQRVGDAKLELETTYATNSGFKKAPEKDWESVKFIALVQEALAEEIVKHRGFLSGCRVAHTGEYYLALGLLLKDFHGERYHKYLPA